MRNAQADLPILKNRLDEMLAYLTILKPAAARSKNPRRERLKTRVKALREAHTTHREICKRLDDEPDFYPSPWSGKTWAKAFNLDRNKVDTYLSKLKRDLS